MLFAKMQTAWACVTVKQRCFDIGGAWHHAMMIRLKLFTYVMRKIAFKST